MAKRGFIDVMKEAISEIAPGLKDAVPEIGAELSRLGTQGTMELASALFGNGAFVPYGPGQYTATPELGKDNQEQEIQKAEPEKEKEQEHDGREM
jgi:hypothetical protein